MDYESYGEKIKDELKNAAFDCAEDKLKRRSEPVAKSSAKELVKFSDVTIERGYKVSYDIAEVSLPPKISREVENHLRHSTKLLKSKNRETIELETVALVNSSISAIMSVAKDEQSFDEASRALAEQGKTAIKNVVIENAKDVAAQEVKKIGEDVAKQAFKKTGLQIFKGGANHPAVKAIVFADMIKGQVLDWIDGKISDEQFIKEVSKKGTLLALETVGAFAGAEIFGATLGQTLIPIPVVGAMVGSTVTAIVCNSLVAVMDASYDKIKELWDASKTQAVADRRKVISKIKTEALVEMERQRDVMKKYFADEKFQWDKNVQEGFELITSGTYSNNAEVIARGLDKILKNFGGQVAFMSCREFDNFFMDNNSVLKL